MLRNLRWTPLVAALALVGACDDNGTDPVDPGNFDPVATEQAVQSLQDQLDEDSDIMLSLGLASDALFAAGSSPPLRIDRAQAPLSAQVMRSLVAAGASAEPILPVELLGVTFEWDEVEGDYLPTERTGAPSNGVRFILYAIDPITKVPASPLNETGFLDLTDEGDAGGTTRLGLYAESGGTALIDYFIDLTYAFVGEDLSVTASAEGYVSDGQDRLDFDLDQSATLQSSTETILFDFSYDMSVAGEGAGVSIDMQGEFDFSGEQPIDAVTATMSITDGTDTVVWTMTLGADNTLNGVITFNGVPVVNVSGTEADPVFTRADGEELTLEEVAALVELFDMVEDIFDIAEDLFEPFGGMDVGI